MLFGGRRADDDDDVAAEEGVGRRRPSDASLASFRLIFSALIRRYGLSSSATAAAAAAAAVVGAGGEGVISPCTCTTSSLASALFSCGDCLAVCRFAVYAFAPSEQPTRSTDSRCHIKATSGEILTLAIDANALRTPRRRSILPQTNRHLFKRYHKHLQLRTP